MSINKLESRERVLFISIQNHISKILDVVLENHDFQIDQTNSAENALEKLRKNSYEMVIMDESCQKCNKIDLLHQIKSEYKDTKFICLVEHAHAPLAVEGILMGAYAVLASPINIPHLATILLGVKALRMFHSPMHTCDEYAAPGESSGSVFPVKLSTNGWNDKKNA